MFNYDPFWRTLEKSSETTYSLIHKFNINPTTISRLRNNVSITMDTLDKLCQALNCNLEDIVERLPDPEDEK